MNEAAMSASASLAVSGETALSKDRQSVSLAVRWPFAMKPK